MLDAIAIASLSGATLLAGVWLATMFREQHRLASVGVGLSSGIMAAISLYGILPTSLSFGWPAWASFALGFVVVLVFDLAFPHIHFVKECHLCPEEKAGYIAMLGIAIHDFPEGFAVFSAFMANPAAGLVVAIGVALHNIPEGFAFSMPLLMANKKRELWRAASLSALAEPAGALLAALAFVALPAMNVLFLSFAAGAMLFVAFDELLPLAWRYGKAGAFAGFVLGVASYAVITAFFA